MFKTKHAAGNLSARFKYTVAVCGGIGPHVWDDTVQVEACSLLDAAVWADRYADERSGWVTMIDQED